jgi:hypothetical protein
MSSGPCIKEQEISRKGGREKQLKTYWKMTHGERERKKERERERNRNRKMSRAFKRYVVAHKTGERKKKQNKLHHSL